MMVLEIVLLVMMVFIVFLVLSKKGLKDENMISDYECGFNSVMGSRVGFSYRFFLISILFLVFDVEITLLVPILYLELGYWQVVGEWMFMLVLLVGLVYEYFNGVLSWVEVENF